MVRIAIQDIVGIFKGMLWQDGQGVMQVNAQLDAFGLLLSQKQMCLRSF